MRAPAASTLAAGTVPTSYRSLCLRCAAGVQKLIGVTVGTFLGGVVTSRLRLTRDGCLRFLLLVVGFSLAIKTLNFYFGCPNPDIWGLHGHA